MIPPVTDSDIDWAESVLGSGVSFDVHARQFIRTLAPVQVVACPGSGKTTALIAKLLILSRSLPLPGNRGICVLTHTNVAVDEITRRLSSIGSAMLSYPSFCGTFQSFVGRYLGYPGYAEQFGCRPSCVDNEVASRELERRNSVPLRKARYYLEQRSMTLEGLRFDKSLQIVKPGDSVPFVGTNTPTYQAVHDAKMAVLKDGYLFYEDVYAFGERYLDSHPSMPALLSHRFPFVFVDEMQDTDERQLRMLKAIFDDRSTLQLVGDPNQAIYSRQNVETGCTWEPPSDALTLPRSLRFGQPIANVVTRLASVAPVMVSGNGAETVSMPHLIVFSDNRIAEVIPTFGAIIASLGIHRLPIRPVFKAIGWVTKEHDRGKHTVRSYWPDFGATQARKRTEYATLRGNLSICTCSTEASTPRSFRRAVTTSVVRFLRAGGITAPSGRNFTEATLLASLHEDNPSLLCELVTRCAEWCLQARTGRDVAAEVAELLKGAVAAQFGVDSSMPAVTDFLTNDDSEELPGQPMSSKLCCFDGGAIEISSVHAVKGETHTATLYLDTFYYGYDVHRILPFLNGILPTGKEQSRVKESMKVAFVGCSRPTHLLCVAIHADTAGLKNGRNTVTEADLTELSAKWEVIDLR